MKNHTLISFLLSMLLVIPAWSQEHKIEKEFMNTVAQTRDRIMTMHGEGELATVQYEEERAVVRQAEQVEQLLKEGEDVDKKTLKEWINKLNRLGRPQSEEREGVQYREKPWPATQNNISNTIEAQHKKLDQKYKSGEIDEKTYKRDKEKLKAMQTELMELKEQMTKLESQMEELEGRVKQFDQDLE